MFRLRIKRKNIKEIEYEVYQLENKIKRLEENIKSISTPRVKSNFIIEMKEGEDIPVSSEETLEEIYSKIDSCYKYITIGNCIVKRDLIISVEKLKNNNDKKS